MPQIAPSRPEFTGFTAHNVVLSDGKQTLPSVPPLADADVTQAVLRMARVVAPPEGARAPRVADLGCLEGGYAVEFARAGYEVVGIEARAANFARCEAVGRDLGLPNLSFVQDDARNIARHGPFDIVFCSGLLYHLDRPVEFLVTLGEVTRRALFLQTHFALADPHQPQPALSPLCHHEGRLGRWVFEHPDTVTAAQMENALWASWGNARSFWIEKKHLLQTMRDVGFPVVVEQFDALSDVVEDRYIENEARSLFVGVKP